MMVATATMPTQNKFHLDKRAGKLLDADPAPEADDQLLTTREVAAYLGMSEQWVTLGRSKKYGPPFVRVGTRRLRYKKSAVRAWLESRTYSSTAEYPAGEAAASPQTVAPQMHHLQYRNGSRPRHHGHLF